MRQLTARPQNSTGRWHYVSLTDRGGHPIGYCAEHDAHETEEQARECYARWQRDHLTLDGKSQWSPCMVPECDRPANRVAQVRGDYAAATLCEVHLDREHAVAVLGLDGPAGDAWVS